MIFIVRCAVSCKGPIYVTTNIHTDCQNNSTVYGGTQLYDEWAQASRVEMSPDEMVQRENSQRIVMLFLHDGTSLCVTTSCNSHIKPQCVAIVKRMSQIHGNDLMEKGIYCLVCNCKRSIHMAFHINSGSQNNWQHSVMKTYLNSVHTSREVISPEGISLSIWYRGGSLRIVTKSLDQCLQGLAS